MMPLQIQRQRLPAAAMGAQDHHLHFRCSLQPGEPGEQHERHVCG